MLTPRIRAALVVLAASAGLSACTSFGPYGGIGVGVGNGYGSYGSYGYDPYYSGYGYGSPYYGSYYPSYYGWYDGFYYPGSGYWVYDPGGNQHPITDRQKSYWRNMLDRARQANGTLAVKENWSGFKRPSSVSETTATGTTATTGTTSRSVFRQRALERQQQARVERQQVQSERQQTRSERFEARQQAISERQESRRARRGSTDE